MTEITNPFDNPPATTPVIVRLRMADGTAIAVQYGVPANTIDVLIEYEREGQPMQVFDIT